MKLKVDNSINWYLFRETILYRHVLNGRLDKLVNDSVNIIYIFRR